MTDVHVPPAIRKAAKKNGVERILTAEHKGGKVSYCFVYASGDHAFSLGKSDLPGDLGISCIVAGNHVWTESVQKGEIL